MRRRRGPAPGGATGCSGTAVAVVAGLALAAGLATPAGAAAQDVRLAGAPGTDAERAVAAFLERGGYVVWSRDTVLARGEVVSSHILVLEASVRIAGRVEGDVLVLDGDLFLRTRGEVLGDVTVFGGGFYDSELATVDGAITYRPNERIRVRPTEGAFEVFSVREPRDAFELDGTWGIHVPVYQRVDAVTLGFGGVGRAASAPGRPELEFVARYLTGPGELEGTLRNSWYASGRVRVGVSASRETRTNDGWIRPTWYNSLATLVAEDDAADYYRTDRLALELELVSPEPPIWVEGPAWRAVVQAGWEEARSLNGRDIWALFDEDGSAEGGAEAAVALPNPAVDDGDLFFVAGGFDWIRRGREGRTSFGLGFEAAHDEDLAGELSFLRTEARVSARHATSWGHAWDVFGIFRTDLAGTLPRQRYSTLGGIGTVPTLPLRGLRGPRLLYVEATYAVPLLGLATLGGLDIFARGSGGAAWGEGAPLRFEEAVMAGLAVRLWDFQMELGAAAGAGPAGDGLDTTVYFDVRVRRSAVPSTSPPPGRSF